MKATSQTPKTWPQCLSLEIW